MDIKNNKLDSIAIRISLTEGEKELGHTYLYLIKNDLHNKPYGLVEDLCVDESVRGRGMGSKLIEELIKIAKNEGCYKIIATSRHEREKVHKFYEKNGFQKYGLEFRFDL